MMVMVWMTTTTTMMVIVVMMMDDDDSDGDDDDKIDNDNYKRASSENLCAALLTDFPAKCCTCRHHPSPLSTPMNCRPMPCKHSNGTIHTTQQQSEVQGLCNTTQRSGQQRGGGH